MAEFVKVATRDMIPDDGVVVVEHEGEQIALYNIKGQIYATSNICSHSYAELHEGFLDSDDCTIECPLHGARFDICTGAALSLPAFDPIDTYPVQIDGDAVLIGAKN